MFLGTSFTRPTSLILIIEELDTTINITLFLITPIRGGPTTGILELPLLTLCCLVIDTSKKEHVIFNNRSYNVPSDVSE